MFTLWTVGSLDSGFLVKTLTACLSDILPFMTVLVLATVAFGLTFHLQMPSGVVVEKNLVAQSLWDSMLMAMLGDNGGLAVERTSALGLVVCFLLLTLVVNVIMMNVLIAIVSQTQERIRTQREATYATFWAETLTGMDACFPRKRCRAFADEHDKAEISFSETHNEVRYPMVWLLIKWAFSEPLNHSCLAMACKSSPATLGQKPHDVLGCVHVISAASSDVGIRDGVAS